jgi:predicted CXXCH cytochrome family protein
MRHSKRLAARRKKGGPRLIYIGLIVGVLALVAISGTTAYALNLEDHDAFCASCHTQPESQYYQQSLEKTPTTLAAFHTQKGVRCIDCHSGAGPFGRAVGLWQGTQDLAAYYSGHYHSPAITQNKLGDGSCTKCHADVFARQDFDNHFHVFLSRWQSVDPKAAYCVDCHTAHPTADATQAYLQTAPVEQICQDCHAVLAE